MRHPTPQPTDTPHLSVELIRLTDEVRVLRDAVDELREQLTSAVRNGRIVIELDVPRTIEPPKLPLTESDSNEPAAKPTSDSDASDAQQAAKPKAGSPSAPGMLF